MLPKLLILRLKSCIALIWWHLPLKRELRHKIKTLIFSTFGFLFRNTRPYKNWADIKKLSSKVDILPNNTLPPTWILNKADIEFAQSCKNTTVSSQITDLAIVIHAYYFDIFSELLSRIVEEMDKIPQIACKLYVSTHTALQSDISKILMQAGQRFEIEVFENRGRDILPFIRMVKKIESEKSLILKLHTKQSDHRLTGKQWRNELYNNLLLSTNIKNAIKYFNDHRDIGIVAPKGNLLPMNLYYGANAAAISFFCHIFGIGSDTLKTLNFAAGSMFFARKSAIEPLLRLNLPDSMFEPENGQTDGTMAHALERVFSISAYFTGLQLSDTTFPPKIRNLNITKNHPYTW